ncbi:MAG: uL15m family ribosomal protein [Candidatus Woesearchaeota archaeon]
MSSNKRKTQKYRGHKTHGGGAMKKRRGAGSRGGRGNAGSGKRSDNRKPSYWKLVKGREYLGKWGFTSIKDSATVLNVSDLEDQLPSLVEKGFASEKKGAFVVDLGQAGIDKLLGSGNLSVSVQVTVDAASQRAIEKVEAAGGSVSLKEE